MPVSHDSVVLSLALISLGLCGLFSFVSVLRGAQWIPALQRRNLELERLEIERERNALLRESLELEKARLALEYSRQPRGWIDAQQAEVLAARNRASLRGGQAHRAEQVNQAARIERMKHLRRVK